MEYTIKNAAVFQHGGFQIADLLIRDGRIVSIGIVPDSHGVCIDLSSKYVVFPGFSDVHVHLREPGFSYKETIRTGTMAAARGGFTSVCAMPNLCPVPDCAEHLGQQLEIIKKDACIYVHPYAAITKEQAGESLADLDALASDAIAFSDDGRGVQQDGMMRKAMLEAKRLGKIIAAHCEDNSLLRGGYIHDGQYAHEHGHRGICSESEWKQIERDLKLVEEIGCKKHVCHISTKESVDLIRRAKARGVDVTCETGPHYLVLTDMDLQEDGRFKMNPPLRSAEDRKALLDGILDGTIDMIATDHAPHSAEEKSRGLEKSTMGVVGLETSFSVCYTHLVKTGLITLEKLIDLMHGAAMRRFGIGTQLKDGAPADFTVFDLECTYTIDPDEFLSLGKATPFAGMRVAGRCLMTVCGGRIVWSDGTLTQKTNLEA